MEGFFTKIFGNHYYVSVIGDWQHVDVRSSGDNSLCITIREPIGEISWISRDPITKHLRIHLCDEEDSPLTTITIHDLNREVTAFRSERCDTDVDLLFEVK